MISDYKYIVAIFTGWLAAQLIKSLILIAKNKSLKISDLLFMSGGMPSSHSSLIVSVTTLIALTEGYTSAITGLAVAVAIVIIYDSVKVRKSVGDQAELLTELVKNSKSKPPKIVRGHTVLEAFAGIILGIVVGTVVYLLTK